MAGKDGHPIGKQEQTVDALVLREGVATTEVRAPRVASEEAIAGEHQHGLQATVEIDNLQRDQLRPVPWCVHGAEPQLT